MAKITITYTPAVYPFVYEDGFDGITIPAVFVGQNAYIDGAGEHTYDKSQYDTNNYGLGIDWKDTFENFKKQIAHPGLIAAMKKAYEAAVAASINADKATAGSADYNVDGVAGPVVEYLVDAINSEAGYSAEFSAE